MIWRSGTTVLRGIAPHTTMQRLELVTECAVWERHLIWTLSQSLEDLIWYKFERVLGDKEYTCINEN